MEQCKGCLFENHQKDLLCCRAAQLSYAGQELLRSIPVLGKVFTGYICTHRAECTPCSHGYEDWDDCPDCRH